jgi:hypothetical protein
MSAALEATSRAVQLAVENNCPAVLIAELRNTRADLLRLVGRDREAFDELNAISTIDMPPALRWRFPHLKAVLLKHYGAPQALEHLLESYQHDRLRGDDGGVAVSLLAIARIFMEEHEYDRARERIREALPLADACGLVNVVVGVAILTKPTMLDTRAKKGVIVKPLADPALCFETCLVLRAHEESRFVNEFVRSSVNMPPTDSDRLKWS